MTLTAQNYQRELAESPPCAEGVSYAARNWDLERLTDNELVDRQLVHPFTKMRSSGVIYMLCPLHDEKTPSLVLRPASRRWQCYGCQRSGRLPEVEPTCTTQLGLFR